MPQGHSIPGRDHCGTRWQVQADKSEKLHNRDAVMSRWRQVQGGLAKLQLPASWSARQESQEQSKQTCEVVTCGLLAGTTGPPGMLPPGTVFSHLDMGHPGSAGSGEVKT